MTLLRKEKTLSKKPNPINILLAQPARMDKNLNFVFLWLFSSDHLFRSTENFHAIHLAAMTHWPITHYPLPFHQEDPLRYSFALILISNYCVTQV